jgi:hypothetical protein
MQFPSNMRRAFTVTTDTTGSNYCARQGSVTVLPWRWNLWWTADSKVSALLIRNNSPNFCNPFNICFKISPTIFYTVKRGKIKLERIKHNREASTANTLHLWCGRKMENIRPSEISEHVHWKSVVESQLTNNSDQWRPHWRHSFHT